MTQRNGNKGNEEAAKIEFANIGQRNIQYALAGDHVLLRVPRDAKTLQEAPLSSTGKMRIAAMTGPWVEIPGTDGLRMMLQVGMYANPK